MHNILTYLDWRGDITFAERGFNSVDNLILCELVYIDFMDIVPDISTPGSRSTTIRDAYKKIRSRSEKVTATKGNRFSDVYTSLLEKLAASDRFGGARLSRLVDIYDEIRQMQFAAMCIELDDNTTYIAFRGTDQTIIGWREDFSTSFQLIPAQVEAVRYLEKAMLPDEMYRIGGHSKGGNLAVYAAMMCRDELNPQMIAIYNNDGPGLSKEILVEEKYSQIKNKIQRIVPQFCVIGMLFENDSEKQIVKSDTYGILQHDSMSWVVNRDRFVTVDDLHPDSKTLNTIISEWLEDMDVAERKAFTNHFFHALGASGAKSIFDVPKGGVGSFGSVLMALAKSEKETKVASGKLAKTVRKEIRGRIQEGFKK
ncbi:MAG: DUF2974 domain-containing protein [Oscillospiraceae bacterium]|nr:DUF2974 domain-containing protein [Oscillospiraceae bacterium]